MFRCPFHKDDSASFAVFRDHAHCFGACSWHGDVIGYAQESRSIDFKSALAALGEDARLPQYKPRHPVEKEVERKIITLTMADVERDRINLHLVKPYLDSRKIDAGVVDMNMIGASTHQHSYVDITGRAWNFEYNRVALPYIFGEGVYSMNYRRDDLSAMKSMKAVGDRSRVEDLFRLIQIDLAEKAGHDDPDQISHEKVMYHCFGPRFYRPGTPVTAYGVRHFVRKDGDKLIYPMRPYGVITEGEFNALSAESECFPCMALKPVERINLRRLTQNIRILFIAVDPDEAGERYANAILESLGSDYAKARKMIMPEGFKDMNEMRKADILSEFLTRKPYYLEPLSLEKSNAWVEI